MKQALEVHLVVLTGQRCTADGCRTHAHEWRRCPACRAVVASCGGHRRTLAQEFDVHAARCRR